MLVFDLTDQNSFSHLSSWHDEFIIQAGEGKDFVLIGNKNDLEDKRCVSQKAALAWCRMNSKDDQESSIPYFETSAKENFNVEQAFLAVAKGALKKAKVENDVLPVPGRVALGSKQTPQKKGCSC
eukprot:Sspe_Gene.29970::Locus_14525_Transcript_2_2_Confidence_0.500_Length_758::g.29970::m.29970/K07897/RAB7A; Ras-related protein Rab-7A